MDRRLAILSLLFFCLPAAFAIEPCRIEVVEKGSGWPVPLVELRTTSQLRFVTDNAGVIAFDAPEFLGRETWFDVIGHGYELPRDGFGYRGLRFVPKPGKTYRIEVERKCIARRLGRITGAGIFAESQKLGDFADWKESGITGQDTVQLAPYGGKLFWMWGDTNVPWYPLGVFDATAATTSLQPLAKFEPPIALAFDYFRNGKAEVRGVAPMKGEGPTWITGSATLPDKDGREHLVCTFLKVRGFLDIYEVGLAEWNKQTSHFEPVRILWHTSSKEPKPAPYPAGHAVFWKDNHEQRWILFGDGFPDLRFPATYEAWNDPSKWEPVSSPSSLRSAAGKEISVHRASIAWNAFRKRWVAVFQPKPSANRPGASGEIWYAEAKKPTGPWGIAVQVLAHENYTFYNPRLHPELTPADSPVLLFEGTYTAEFADHPAPTPRDNYNQILYRLDLDAPALEPARQP